MKVLNAEQLGKIDMLVDELRLIKASIHDKLNSVNGVINVLNEEIEAYNAVLEKVHFFREEVADAIEADWKDEEEDWYTSKEGEDQAAWKDEWEQRYVERIDTVSEVEVEPLKHDDELLTLSQTT